MKSIDGPIETRLNKSVGTGKQTTFRAPSRRHFMSVELLEPRHLLAGLPVITEFMTKNDGFHEDGDGNAPDWIEIQNIGDSAMDLRGYRLTDRASDLERWTFPSVTIAAGEYLVVFASSQDVDDYVDAAGNLHTNFGLQSDGEYLALVSPDGNVVSQYGSVDQEYPAQSSNVSYGVPQKQLLVHDESDAHYFVPVASDVENWTSVGFDAPANGFSVGKAAMGVETEPDSRTNFADVIITDLPTTAYSVYSRMEFDIDDVDVVSRVNLRMRYDNGFVAYLNGVRVASENAPDNVGWFSTAVNRVPRDSRALEFVDIDLTQHVSHLHDGRNVLAIHGLNHISDRSDMLLAPRLVATVNDPTAVPGFMVTPTPGAENVGDNDLFVGILDGIEINGQPGFYDEPFTVTIDAETPDVQIRYTTDGAPPTTTTGFAYTGNPIPIDSTTTLRAAAFKEGHIPSQVATQSYLFLEEIIHQPQEQPGLPTQWLWTEDRNFYPADYEMDPEVVGSSEYRDQIIDSLKSLRTLSIAMDPDDLFGPDGMHNNTELHGRESEHPVSLEILNPDGSLAHQVNAGFRIHGNFTRHYNVTMKQSFRLTFRGDYGATNLEYPLFANSPADAFDNVILHAGKIRDDAQLVSNSFGRDTNLAMGNVDAHSTHVHLYLNGLYWGVYNPFERPDGQFGETYFGGLDSEYDSILNINEAVDGSNARFRQLVNASTISGLDTKEEYEEYLRQVDLDSLIDFLLINQYMAHNEHEFRALGNREGDADIRFMIWDVDEQALSNARAREDIDTYFPAGVFEAITRHPEMRMHYADRIQKHLFNGGALTTQAAQARWEGLAQSVRPAVIAESARWGDMRWRDSVPRQVFTLEDFDRFGERLAESFFPVRTEILLEQLKSIWNVFPDVAAPQWNRTGGPVSSSFQLTMSNPNRTGIILYTLDGTDPRQYGGDVASDVLIHDGAPISVTGTTVVKARVFADGEWSPLMEGEFVVVGPDSPFHLRVTEVNYNPHEANLVPGLGEADVDKTQFEFLEITNTSSATIDTSGIQLTRGVQFTFPENSTLAAGQHALIVNNELAFESRYGSGLNVIGEFENDALPDSQGFIDLRDDSGREIQTFAYQGQSWSRRASGRGSSLELIDPLASSAERSNLRESSQFGGSPGATGSDSDNLVAITEVLAHSENAGGDSVELHNESAAMVDISRWYLSTTDEDYFMYRVPPGTMISANGFQVLSSAELGFELSEFRGDELWLVAADAGGRPVRFVDHIRFGPSAEEVTLGQGPDPQTWLPLAEPTLGRANSGFYVGEAIISEVHHAPLDPDGDRRTFHADDFEFVELYNTTDTVVDLSGWRLSGDVELTIPANTTIDVGKSLLLVPFDPSDFGKSAIFSIGLEVGDDVPLVGPYSGTLGDETGSVRLHRPGQPPAEDPIFIPLLYVDEVNFDTVAPWPTDSVGSGNSLTRRAVHDYGNAAETWFGNAASPGTVNFVFQVPGDSNGDGVFNPLDLIQVLQADKYQTGEPALFAEGDWNRDGLFDPLDIVAVLQEGNYLTARASRHVAFGFDPAMVKANEQVELHDHYFAQIRS